ncbi:MAG: CocE/NonD family hydrolase [bacterium]
MSGLMQLAARLALGFTLGGAPAHSESGVARSDPFDVYDVYIVGVRVAELTVNDHGASRTYTIRKKDMASNQWRPPVTASENKASRDTAFALPGSIKRLVASMHSLRTIRWSSHKTVSWPDAKTTYLQYADQRENVNDQSVSATRWIQRDATNPMDFVIASDDQLIAAIDVTHDVVLVRRGYEQFTTIGRWRDPKISQPKYGYRALPMVMMPTSDGVKLATLVYLPDGGISGPVPVVFIRTPYGIGSQIQEYWHYAARGYALVFQAARGTFYMDPQHKSEGVWEPMVNEPKDGAESLAWIARQPWSNGKICMMGGSYVGYTQWAATMAGNPALKCIIPESSMGTAFSDEPYWGGTVGQATDYIFFMLNQHVLPNRTKAEIEHHRPLRDLDRFATGQNIPQWKMLMDHLRNDEHWNQQDWYNAKVPRNFGSLQISGWFDDDFPGTESNWALTQRTDSAPRHLIVGPWRHSTNTDRALNGFSFGPDALRDDMWLLKQQTVDHFLKDADNGIPQSKVDYFLLGDNSWRTASQWPPVEAQPQSWYFHSRGEAQRNFTNGSLNTSAPSGEEPPDRYLYDPKLAPPNWMSVEKKKKLPEDLENFPYDFTRIDARRDVVKFTSSPLAQDLTIAGDVMLVLYASTSVRDTDWWVRLSDVDSSGHSIRLTTGVLRARFRDAEDKVHHVFGSNYEHEALLSGNPSDVVRYDISLRSIANTFKKGHRIRVAIMNALDKSIFPNSNTGGNEATVTETVIGKMAIHHTATEPSHIVLPVMPRVQPAMHRR